MRPIDHLVCLFFVISAVSAATVVNSFSAEGSGSVGRHIDTTFENGLGTDFVSGTSSSVLLTAPGKFEYQTRDTTDATTGNRYNQTGYVRFRNGGVGSESVSMTATSPSQTAEVDHSYILQSASIDTSKFVNGPNLSAGQEASWDGAGLYTRDASYAVEVIDSENGKPTHYVSEQTDHGVISTNSTGGAIVRPEFSFTGFGDAFVVNKTEIVNQTNITETNETVNLTGE